MKPLSLYNLVMGTVIAGGVAIAAMAESGWFAFGTILGLYVLLGIAVTGIVSMRNQRDAMQERKDGAYEERNRVVAAFARSCQAFGYKVGVTRTSIPDWNPEWHGCLYIEAPTFQASWHFHDSQAHLFLGFPEWRGTYNGHTTDQKYADLHAWRPVPVVMLD